MKLAALALVMLLTGRATPDAAEVPSTPSQAVSVVPASRQALVRTIGALGSLVPEEDVNVSAQVGGYPVQEVAAEQGQRVERGQVLATLAPDTLDVQLTQNTAILQHQEALIAQATSQIEQMRSASVQAEAALQRARRLILVGAATQEVLDQRVSSADVAKAQLGMAESSLALARADLALATAQRRELMLNRDRTLIRAPTDGIILSRAAQIGAIVAQNGPPLFHLARHGTIELAADVIEGALPSIEVGQAVAVHIEGLAKPVAGVVRLVSPQVDRATRLGSLRVSLAEQAGLRAGLFARAEIVVDRHDGIVVPPSAVQARSGGESVKIVIDGNVETRAVTTGIRSLQSVEILRGVEAGQAIVARAGSFLHDGERVVTVAEGSQR